MDDSGISVLNNEYHCENNEKSTQSEITENGQQPVQKIAEKDTTTGYEPVHLDNEVASNVGVKSIFLNYLENMNSVCSSMYNWYQMTNPLLFVSLNLWCHHQITFEILSICL